MLGYAFARWNDAERARRAIRQRCDVDDAELAELANDGVLLAVRAAEDTVDGLVDVDERWTRPRG